VDCMKEEIPDGPKLVW